VSLFFILGKEVTEKERKSVGENGGLLAENVSGTTNVQWTMT